MGLLGAVLGLSCDPVGQSWEPFEASLAVLGARLDRFGALLGGLEPFWSCGSSLGAVVGLCWGCWTRPPLSSS